MDCNLIWLKIWVNFVWTSGQRLLRRGHPAEKYARGLVFCFFFFFFFLHFTGYIFLSFPFTPSTSFRGCPLSFDPPFDLYVLKKKHMTVIQEQCLKLEMSTAFFYVWICFITHWTQTYMIWQKLRNFVFYNQLKSCSSISVNIIL